MNSFPIRILVIRSVRFGRYAFFAGALWCLGRAWLEAQGAGRGVPWSVYIVGFGVSAALLGRSLLASRRLDRPAVEVSDDEIVWGTVFREGRSRLPLEEVRSVRSAGLAALDLETRSGREIRINTYEVDPEERAALRQAIERRVTDHGR